MTELLSAAHSQLVLVDYQARLMPAMAGGQAALANAHRLAEGARLLGVPVWGTEENPRGLGPMPDALRALCQRVLPKMAFDATGEGLAAALSGHAQRRHVVIAGCEAHVCLMQTALGLRAAGWDVWVAEDACASRAEANRQSAFRRLAAAGARRVTTEMVLFEWVRGAGHARFGDVLRLIK